MATYLVTRHLPAGTLTTTVTTPDQVLFVVEAMLHRGITVTVTTEGCYHPGLFANDEGPEVKRYCPECNGHIPNRDL